MPELVPSRAYWDYSKNNSGPLFPESDRGVALNSGCEWVVTVWLADRAAMLTYGPHPKHQELMALQSTKLTADGKCVLDPMVGTGRIVPLPISTTAATTTTTTKVMHPDGTTVEVTTGCKYT